MTAAQHAAAQKQAKRGNKLRKDLLADEERLRGEAAEELDADMAVIDAEFTVALSRTKDRLIKRLTQNLDALRQSSAEAQRAAEESQQSLNDTLSTFSKQLARDQVVEPTVAELVAAGAPAAAVAAEVLRMADVVAAALKDGADHVAATNLKMTIQQRDLDSMRRQLRASDKIMTASFVRGGSEASAAAEALRREAAAFQQRMAEVERANQAMFDELLLDAATIDVPADCTAAFLTQRERVRLQQAQVLRDVQAAIVRHTAVHVSTHMYDVRSGRSNLPTAARDALRDADRTSRDDLLRIIDYASFEPHVTETILAAVDLREAADDTAAAMEPRADAIDDECTAAIVPRLPSQRSQLLPPKRPLLVEVADRAAAHPGFLLDNSVA
jgi:hypothetical protein